ncbi:hypothetical protein B0H13DRAFT_2334800 [Mycena leptocephala]|nr:hypothetical protein B0H13DRAFT_2411182 [Mycena leptocephala]KAJ7904128.1 hypothetical protein B0H13DRAFT_2334800 [Mycena leptocephala]
MSMALAGRGHTALLRHSAQDALERTWCEAVSLDASLAETALVRSISQTSSLAHETDPPDYRPIRSLTCAFVFLDEVISVLRLTSIDAGSVDDAGMHMTPHWFTPPWDPSWGEHEVRDEECCWVCWAALSLTTSFRTEFLALLCPDSAHKRAGRRGSLGSGWQEGGGAAAHPKNAILVLYCGSLLLACNTEHTIDDVKAKIQDKQGIPQDQRHSSLESSSSMAPRCRTTTSRGRALFTLCSTCVVV